MAIAGLLAAVVLAAVASTGSGEHFSSAAAASTVSGEHFSSAAAASTVSGENLSSAAVAGAVSGEGLSSPAYSTNLQAIVDSVIESGPGRNDDSYRDPTSGEAAWMAAAVSAMHKGLRPQMPTGYVTTTIGAIEILAEHTKTGSTAGSGMAAVRPSSNSNVVIEVPHPVSDRHTAGIGVELFEETNSSALLVAGAHRKAANGRADAAHNPNSAFAVMDSALVGAGWTVVQLHGFSSAKHSTDEYANVDVVLSSSMPSPSEFLLAIDARLRAQGFTTCVYDGHRCDELSGSTNVQARHANTVGADFIHVEMSDNVRGDRRAIERLVGTLADAIDAV